MTILRPLLISALVLGAVGSCANDPQTPPQTPPDGPIDYQRDGGFDGGHRSSHIDPDGKMTRVGGDGSMVTSTLSASVLGDLARKIDEAQFPTLAATYEGTCPDDYLHTISVEVDGTSYTVSTAGCAKYPERLRPLIHALSALNQDVFEN